MRPMRRNTVHRSFRVQFFGGSVRRFTPFVGLSLLSHSLVTGASNLPPELDKTHLIFGDYDTGQNDAGLLLSSKMGNT